MRVSLVGAGPGSRGLMTLKALQRLKEADIVFYDRFVSDEILDLIPQDTQKVDVGKQAGNHPVPQEKINQLLLEAAQKGLEVVRLKGGDPFVFGRGGEELELLAQNNIPFEVVPGITSAIAGATYGGIPVTHRDYVSSVHIITGHAKNNQAGNIAYESLVKAGGTLVFLMGVSSLEAVCQGCLDGGMDKDMPAALIENASLSTQRSFVGTVESLPAIAREHKVVSPALIVIGKVCQLASRFNWFEKTPLRGCKVVVVRAKQGPSELGASLRELGCEVVEVTSSQIIPLTGAGCPLEQALQSLDRYGWLVFTSGQGVRIFFGYLVEHGIDIRSLQGLRIACVGSRTRELLAKRGICADYVPQEYNAEALAQGLAGLVLPHERVLIVRAQEASLELNSILAQAGIGFDDVPLYKKVPAHAEDAGGARPEDTERQADYVAFTSSSGVEWFAKGAFGDPQDPSRAMNRIKAVCIGIKTAEAAASLGMEVHVAKEATLKGMVEAITQLYKEGRQ